MIRSTEEWIERYESIKRYKKFISNKDDDPLISTYMRGYRNGIEKALAFLEDREAYYEKGTNNDG